MPYMLLLLLFQISHCKSFNFKILYNFILFLPSVIAGIKMFTITILLVVQTLNDVLHNYFFTRSTYSPVRVSTFITSPSLTNIGTWTVAPVSTVTGFKTLVAVSPFTPGSA